MNDGEMIVNDEVRIWKQATLTYLKILPGHLLLQTHGLSKNILEFIISAI